MVQNCLNYIYFVLANMVEWLTSTYLTDNVSIGHIFIVVVLFAIVMNSFMSVANSN